MVNPLDWDYLSEAPTGNEVLGPFSLVYMVIFGGGFLVASYVYYRPWTRPLGQWVRRKTVRKASSAAVWVFGIGLFFLLIRLLQINPFTFGNRIWMYLCLLALIILLAYFALGYRQAVARTTAERAQGNRYRPGATYSNPVRRPVRRRRQAR